MIPKNVYELCQGGQSISSELAKNPTLSPHEAAKKLFGVDADDEIVTKKLELGEEKPSDLEEARKCGNWGTSNPSDLFLRVRTTNIHRLYAMLTRWPDLPRCLVYAGEESAGGRLLAVAHGFQRSVPAHDYGHGA
jgi:hypothetical protein